MNSSVHWSHWSNEKTMNSSVHWLHWSNEKKRSKKASNQWDEQIKNARDQWVEKTLFNKIQDLQLQQTRQMTLWFLFGVIWFF